MRISDEQRLRIEELIAGGPTQEQAAVAVGCDVRTVIRWIMRAGGLRGYERRRSPRRLSLLEREQVGLGLALGDGLAGALLAWREPVLLDSDVPQHSCRPIPTRELPTTRQEPS